MDADFQISRTVSIPAQKPAGVSISKAKGRSISWVKQIVQALAAAGLAVASYYFISHYLVQSVQVVGTSMVPTLHDSEHYLLNRWVYHFKTPQRSEVVVIRDPAAGCFSVKRIIGIEGDAIFLKDGSVFLNGQKLNEPYLYAKTPTFAIGHSKEQLIMCGKDQFFLLGDNRMNSADSRVYGPVPRKNIVGMLVN